jgi:hypothetical protein
LVDVLKVLSDLDISKMADISFLSIKIFVEVRYEKTVKEYYI